MAQYITTIRDKDTGTDYSIRLDSEYIKVFNISDFKKVGSLKKYCLAIPKSEHGLTNPYVAKAVLNLAVCDEDDDTNTATGPIVCKERLLPTGTIKVYVTVDLSKYTEYSGKIYLKGE